MVMNMANGAAAAEEAASAGVQSIMRLGAVWNTMKRCADTIGHVAK